MSSLSGCSSMPATLHRSGGQHVPGISRTLDRIQRRRSRWPPLASSFPRGWRAPARGERESRSQDEAELRAGLCCPESLRARAAPATVRRYHQPWSVRGDHEHDGCVPDPSAGTLMGCAYPIEMCPEERNRRDEDDDRGPMPSRSRFPARRGRIHGGDGAAAPRRSRSLPGAPGDRGRGVPVSGEEDRGGPAAGRSDHPHRVPAPRGALRAAGHPPPPRRRPVHR